MDPDTGFVRFGWRDYDPAVGRFTAPDPARDMRGDGDLYDYCMDDPVSRVDPTGLWSKENFDESKVSRDGDGRFASGGGEDGGNVSGGGTGGRSASGGAARKELTPEQRVGDKVREAEARPKATSEEGQAPERRYYVIGKRPLDTWESSTRKSNVHTDPVRSGTWEHRQLIADNGNNSGYFPEGVREDSAGNMKLYRYYDTHKYKAGFIDEAIRWYEAARDAAMRHSVQEYSLYLHGGEEVPPVDSRYRLPFNNCQDYVKDIIEMAEDLAAEKGESLYYE